jgi:DNA-binding LacI/PurR family transcriptional regulator
MVTIANIAKTAGVAKSTVSRLLMAVPSVKPPGKKWKCQETINSFYLE